MSEVPVMSEAGEEQSAGPGAIDELTAEAVLNNMSEQQIAAAEHAADAAIAQAAAEKTGPDIEQEGDGMEWKVQAEGFKASGNESFKAGRWQEAVTWYTQAIELDPEDRVYYSNRSAAYAKLGGAKSKALKDAEKCMELGKDWPKAYSRSTLR